jgi:hypothetical protein
VRYRGDSVLAFDTRNDRVSVLGSDLTFARSFVLDTPESPTTRLVSAFADGALLLQALDFTPFAGGLPSGVFRTPERWFRYDPSTTRTEELARLPGKEYVGVPVGGNPIPDVMGLPYGKESTAGAFADGFFTASSDTYEVRFFDTNAHVTRIVRRLGWGQRVDGAEAKAVRASIVEPLQGQPERPHLVAMLRTMTELEFPARRPAFGRLANVWSWPTILVDPGLHLWVQQYTALDLDTTALRFDVFDSTGTFLGPVDFPEGFMPLDIGADRIAGVWRDPDGVEHVRVHAIVRPE